MIRVEDYACNSNCWIEHMIVNQLSISFRLKPYIAKFKNQFRTQEMHPIFQRIPFL